MSGVNKYIERLIHLTFLCFSVYFMGAPVTQYLLQILSFYLLGVPEKNQGNVHKCKNSRDLRLPNDN
jgi:hypothetical protein